jgi:hypothetical protein
MQHCHCGDFLLALLRAASGLSHGCAAGCEGRRSDGAVSWKVLNTCIEPQITPRNTSFTRNYICKCNVNVNRGHRFTITLHLQGLFRHLHVIGVNDGLQPFLTVAGVSCAQIRLQQLIYVHIAS